MTALKDSHHLGKTLNGHCDSLLLQQIDEKAFLERIVHSGFTAGLTMVENCGDVFLCFCGGGLVVVWWWVVVLLCFCAGVVVFLW